MLRGGVSLLDNKKVTSTPTPTNSITDALRSNSNIQFSSNSRSSSTGGEIAPPRVSIRGSQHYENSFLINGISNNNNLNPSGLSGTDASGEAQSLFLDTSLIESITIYTENTGAEYGGFTGGVVDAKLKDAHTDRWHFMTKYRYTSDGLTKFHLTDSQKEINQSISEAYQPEFNKYEYIFSADGPINDNLGLMLSYGKQHSKIPLWSEYDVYKSDGVTKYKEQRTQFRDNENYLIKLNTHNIDDFEASLTALYAPYTHRIFFSHIRDSDYDVKGGGLNIAYDMKNVLNFGILKTTLAYKKDESSVKTDKNTQWWWTTVPDGYANWGDGTAMEGYPGGTSLYEQSLIYKGVLEFDEIDAGLSTHSIKTGIEAEFGRAGYKRGRNNQFRGGNVDNSSTGTKEDGVIEDEQWIGHRMVYEAVDNKKTYLKSALFLEDTIEFDRYTIRPGIRLSTDTVTNNKDIAPRLFANADIFDDKTLNVYGGYNRYYGGLIIRNAVFENKIIDYDRGNYSEPWVKTSWEGNMDYNMDGMKTPYSDEFSIGTSLNYQDTLFKFDFVKREYKDQVKLKEKEFISLSTGGYQWNFINTNEGRSSYWGATLTASKEYELGNSKHFSEFSITRSQAKSNMMGLGAISNYNDAGYSLRYVTYDGKLTLTEDVPSPNYNSPWIITYTHITELSDSLRLGLNARYEKGVHGFKYLDDGGLKDPDNLNTRNYISKDFGDIFTIDLSASYDLKIKGNRLTFGLEILNLLNRKNDASYTNSYSNIDGYAMGRQFFANFKYEY
jgi:hypothetical protein